MKTHNFELVGGDTDGLAFKKADQKPFTDEERAELLADLNSHMDELIKWEDDGVFKVQLNVKTKNYVLVDQKGKQKIKGSALKATTKEKALKTFLHEVLQLMLTDNQDGIYALYIRYATEILNLKDITDWCSKHTITAAVLTGKGTTQVRIRAALKDMVVQEGDKVYLFFKSDSERCLRENFDGTFCKDTLLGKLFDTLKVFETVLDVKKYPNLALKKHKALRAQLETSNANL